VAENKTRPTGAAVDAFLDGVADPQRREDAKAVRALMERVSGEPAAMWGPSIVGFGSYHYKYESGREGDSCRIGFSPRAKELALYGLGVQRQGALLETLGKHTTGKGCLYIKRLADVDGDVLERLVTEGLAHMRETYPET
jgi:Domain of unknown function (DU1801)